MRIFLLTLSSRTRGADLVSNLKFCHDHFELIIRLPVCGIITRRLTLCTEDEVSLQDLYGPEMKARSGYRKIERCCALAASEGWSYAWIDTCCIDKTSSAELSEAINSMYSWYQNAQVCYVYLADVAKPEQMASDEGALVPKVSIESRWFTRGWTLQELLAPSNLVFYDQN